MLKKNKETIYETYVRILCKDCKNKDKDLCEIKINRNGIAKCIDYKR